MTSMSRRISSLAGSRRGLESFGRGECIWQPAQHLESLGIQLPSTARQMRLLSGGQRQSVAIARAVSLAPRLLILDEPTAALGVRQSALVLNLIREVRSKGTSVVLVSHRMNDILAVCDRIVVLFEGSNAATLDSNVTVDELVRHIVTDPLASATA